MFGSLVLQLPTEEGYTGGRFVVKHNHKVQEFDCRMVSAIGFCYTVFFADCLHELQKIESGTKLCLAFNLVKRSRLEPIHKEPISRRLERLESVLEPWLRKAIAKGPNVTGGKLGIPLQHQYTERNLSFAGLKGDDIILKDLLKECRDRNKNQSLDLHLCICTKHTSRNADVDDDDDEDGYRADFKFSNWIGLDDQPVGFRHLQLDMGREVLVAKEELFDSEPDEEEYQCTGNEGSTVESMYHTVILVVWPKVHSVSIACGASVSRALDILQNTFETSDPQFCEQLHQVVLYCREHPLRVWGDANNSNRSLHHQQLQSICKTKTEDETNEDSVTPRLLSLCSRVSMSEDVLQIVHLLSKGIHHGIHHGGKKKDVGHKVGVRSAEVAEAIASVAQVFGWELVSPPIIKLTKECASRQGESFTHLVKQLICMGNRDAGVLVGNIASKCFEARIAELESHKMPEFSWCQPLAKLGAYPEVEEFLKGPQRRYEHRGFESLPEARSFCKLYFENHERDAPTSYSAIAAPYGRGREACCVIEKNRRLFDVSMAHWLKEQRVMERLRLELEKLRSTVPETDSTALTALPAGSEELTARDRLGTEATAETMECAESSAI